MMKLLVLIMLVSIGPSHVLPVQQEAEVNMSTQLEEEPINTEIESVQDSEADEVPGESAGEFAQIRELISLTKIAVSLIILLLTFVINRFVTTVLDNLSEKLTNYRLFIKRLTPITRILIWTMSIYIVIAGVISPPIETIITIGASLGIAVGFASQDLLKNIFGGIMIILDRPFQVGDKISIGDHYGEVLSVGLRSTRMVTPDDSIVSLPNGDVMNRAVSNTNSSALYCQVVSEIYLPASVDVDAVKEIGYKAIYSSPYVYMNKPISIITLNEMHGRNFVVKLRVKAYVLDIRYEFLFKSDVTEMILNECNRLKLIPEDYYLGSRIRDKKD